MESLTVSPGLLFQFVEILKLAPSNALSWVTLRSSLWGKQMLHKLKSRFKQGASERWWVCFVLFSPCCFAFESEETISSSNFPSTQECDYSVATLKDGMQTERLEALGLSFLYHFCFRWSWCWSFKWIKYGISRARTHRVFYNQLISSTCCFPWIFICPDSLRDRC